MSCVFCIKELETDELDGEHHILPKHVRKIFGWTGKDNPSRLSSSIPMCRHCHDVVDQLQLPLINLIKWMKGTPPIPIELAYIIENSYRTIMENHCLRGKPI